METSATFERALKGRVDKEGCQSQRDFPRTPRRTGSAVMPRDDRVGMNHVSHRQALPPHTLGMSAMSKIRPCIRKERLYVLWLTIRGATVPLRVEMSPAVTASGGQLAQVEKTGTEVPGATTLC